MHVRTHRVEEGPLTFLQPCIPVAWLQRQSDVQESESRVLTTVTGLQGAKDDSDESYAWLPVNMEPASTFSALATSPW